MTDWATGTLREYALREQPDKLTVTGIVASPQYTRDHTVLALGRMPGCMAAPCAFLYKSVDGGGTWTRLPALGLAATSLLLPPAYPDDPRIFAGGNSEMDSTFQVSDDGGLTFRTLGPWTSTPVMSPAFSSGDSRIFIPDRPGWQYDDRTKTTRPLAVPALSMLRVSSDLAVSPTFPSDDTMWVGGVGEAEATSTAYLCRLGTCTRSSLPGGIGSPHFLVGTGRTTGVVFAWTTQWLARSDDGGLTFAEVTLAQGTGLFSASLDREGTLYTVQLLKGDRGGRGDSTVVHRSPDGGVTWKEIAGASGRIPNVLQVVALDDGRMLAAPAWGILCSTDDGATWSPRCRP